MTKICFPHYSRGEFNSLNEAFHYLRKREYGWLWFTLTEIVQYNVPYRDYLRENGIESLIKKVIEEVPELKDEQKALNHLQEWVKKEKLATYDIQCYNIKDQITVMGHTFDGLKDIINHREIVGKEYYKDFECYIPQKVETYSNIHIGEIYENYPIFDSDDLSDNRTYQNYIFRKKEITEQDMKNAFTIRHSGNFCMVHEQIPNDLLPILYYGGDGNHMLLASNKEEGSK